MRSPRRAAQLGAAPPPCARRAAAAASGRVASRPRSARPRGRAGRPWGAPRVTVAGRPASAAAASASGTERTLPAGTPAASSAVQPVLRRALAKALRSSGTSSPRCSTRAALVAKRSSSAERSRPMHGAERAEQAVVGGRHRHAPGRGLEVLVRHDVRVRVSVPLRLVARDQRVLGHVHQPGEAAVEQRHLDAPALSPVQRGEHGRGGVQARQHVHERHAHLVGRPVLRPRDRHQPGLGLRDEVVPRAARRAALGAEAGDRAVDDARVALAHLRRSPRRAAPRHRP